MQFPDPVLGAIGAFGLLVVLLPLGVHIGVALGLTGLLGLFLGAGSVAALGQLTFIPYAITSQFVLAVIPLFILMGALATMAGVTTELYTAAQNWLSGVRGGVAMATTVGSAAFGAATGSSVVNSAVFSRIALPEMVRLGYDKRLAAGCVAASGTLAVMIPPSIAAVVFGLVTDQSIGKLLIAGFIPGVLSASLYMAGIHIRARLNPSIAPLPPYRIMWGERIRSLRGVWGILFLFGLVMGGIYFGFFTPTGAGAIGAFGTLFLVVVRRRLNFRQLIDALKQTGTTTSTIFLIIVGGTIFARFLTYTGIIGPIADTLVGLPVPPIVILLVYIVLFIILGMFIDAISIMVMVLPSMFPVLYGLGYDPIWIGIITIKLGEIGAITPPVGINAYVVRKASPIPLTLEDVFAGIYPFLILDLITLALLVAVPSISLVLPNAMS